MKDREELTSAIKLADLNKIALLVDRLLKNKELEIEQLFTMATQALDNGSISVAIKLLQLLREADPQHTDAAITLSLIYNDIGHYQEGEKIFKDASQRIRSVDEVRNDEHINKKFARHHYLLADMYFLYYRFEDAIVNFKKAIQLYPNFFDAHLKLAKAYAKSNMKSLALHTLQELINNHPDLVEAKIALGLFYYAQDKILEARDQWQRALILDSNNKDAQMYLQLSAQATQTSVDLKSHY